jgi:pyridoxamine 5'-phosphate oxidase
VTTAKLRMIKQFKQQKHMSQELKQKITEYISQTRWAILATVREDKAPVLRAMGSFAPDGVDVYFSTPAATAKVGQIGKNQWVNFFFQHEGQELPTFKNVAVIGKAGEVKDAAELKKAIGLLSARNPRFKERAEKGDLKDTAIFKIKSKEIKYLDFARGFGKEGIQELVL